MYKLLLVDDEEEVREGLLHEIDWAKYGFEVVETASNGKEAMELMEKVEPDILITDISMPYMDGLQLADWTRSAYPITRVIILSGYDEFEYAQQAIHLQVDEYVLKPFSAEQLIEIMLKVKARMDDEREKREDIQLLHEHYRTSLPIVRELFLSSLLSRKLPIRQIIEKSERYDLQLLGEAYVVSIIQLHSVDTTLGALEGTSGNRTAVTEVSLASSQDRDLKLFAVRNIAEEIWNKHALGKVFLHQDQVALLTVSADPNPERTMEQTLNGLKETMQNIEKYLKFPVTAGVSSVTPDITRLRYAYEDAELALDYRNILGSNRIICINDVETRFVDKLRFDELKEHALIRCMKVGTAEELHSMLSTLFDEVSSVNASYKEYQLFLLEMVTAIMKLVKDYDLNLNDIVGYDFVIYAEIQKLSGIEETKSWFIALCSKIRNHISSSRLSSYKHLVEDAIAFTKQHYHDSELSIAKVCSHLHISTGYFSGIFKKEVKMTYGNYLLQLRMEAAKELLRTTELKTFEIAEKVGFADPNYFSLCFKKYVGISAKEYRNGLKE